MPKLSSKQNLFLVLAVVSLVVVEGFVFYGGRRYEEAVEQRRQHIESMLAITEVNERKDHTESLVREFVLTGAEPLALRAEKNFAELQTRLTHARQLMGGSPDQVPRLARLDGTLKTLTDRWATTLATRRTQGAEAAEQRVAEGIGRRLTDEAEALLDELEAEETRRYQAANIRAVQFARLTRNATTAGGVLIVFFGFLAWRALRAATAAARTSEESLAITLQSIGDGVLATDAEGRITRLNPVAERLTGWTQAEAAGRPVAEVFNIISETTRQPAFLPVADTLAKGTIHGLANHTLLLARDGTERPIADSCAPIRSRAGEVIGAVLVFRDVTEERRAARELAAIRRHDELLFSSVADGLHELDLTGKIIFENPAAERMLGYAKGELLGRPAHATIHHHHADGVEYPVEQCPIYATLRDGETRTVREEVFWRKAGTSFPVEYVVSPVTDELGRRHGAIVSFRDVTERRRAEEALARSAHEIQDLYNHAPCGYHSVDAEGVFVAVNDTELKWFGRPREELLGKVKHRDLVTPDTRAAYDAGFAYFLQYGEVRDLEFKIARPDGSVMDLLLNATAVRDATGRLLHSRSTMFDITERKRAEAKLASALRANQLIMEHSLDVICTIDGQGRFDFVSKACAKLWGYQPGELVGRPYIDLVHPEDHPATNQAATAIMAGRPVLNFENRYRRKDGTLVPVMWSASWSAEEQRMFCVAHDLTERKQVEADLHRAHLELSRANAKLNRASRHKDEFLANMSHELRTPLNAILGMSELLMEQLFGPLTPRQAKSVSTIASSGQHLLALINDILDLSKIEAGKLELHAEPLNVDEFCQSCLAFVKTQAMQKRISVDLQREPRPLALSADPKRFKQILVNLLTNAVKFTPEGGRIGLTVAAPEGEGLARFTVWDSGIGIASADQTKLFQAFTQVDSGLNRAQEGTGLGLALVAKLVELHGGSVALESEPGKGSRFIVTLPLMSPGEPPPAPEPAAAPAEPQCFRRALVIEDDPTAGEQVTRYLAELEVTSVLHPRGEESVDMALRERPDVILLDVELPGESGWVALARLKEHPQTRDIPVAIVSVVDEPGKARAMGAAAHFTKPVTREQLAAFLHRPFSPKAEPAPRPAPAAPPSGPTILLAEDNEANIETLGAYLKAKGYDMHFALNGLVAVKLARELRPALILMDIQMPMMDGLTAIRELRADAAFTRTPIIALTALAMSGDRERCLAAGATDYMSKPVKLKELTALVEKLLPHTGEGGGI